MSIINELCYQFSNHIVTEETIRTTDYVVHSWKGKAIVAEDEVMWNKIATESFTDKDMAFLKQYIIGFISETKSPALFRDALALLIPFEDKSLTFLYQSWLNQYFREYLLAGSTMTTLLQLLDSCDENIFTDNEDLSDWTNNREKAREYLIEKMNIIV